MTGAKAFVLGCSILAIAIIIGSFASPASSQSRSGFMVASDGRSFVWRVNTTTGEVSYCARTNDTVSASYIKSVTPICSKQSAPVE